jgi:hypothetical protein
MSKCTCDYCRQGRKHKQEAAFQPDSRVRKVGPIYPAKTRKIWKDRIDSERKQLIDSQLRLAERKESEKTCKHYYWRSWCGGLRWEQRAVNDHLKNLEKLLKEAAKQGITDL